MKYNLLKNLKIDLTRLLFNMKRTPNFIFFVENMKPFVGNQPLDYLDTNLYDAANMIIYSVMTY